MTTFHLGNRKENKKKKEKRQNLIKFQNYGPITIKNLVVKHKFFKKSFQI